MDLIDEELGEGAGAPSRELPIQPSATAISR